MRPRGLESNLHRTKTKPFGLELNPIWIGNESMWNQNETKGVETEATSNQIEALWIGIESRMD